MSSLLGRYIGDDSLSAPLLGPPIGATILIIFSQGHRHGNHPPASSSPTRAAPFAVLEKLPSHPLRIEQQPVISRIFGVAVIKQQLLPGSLCC